MYATLDVANRTDVATAVARTSPAAHVKAPACALSVLPRVTRKLRPRNAQSAAGLTPNLLVGSGEAKNCFAVA